MYQFGCVGYIDVVASRGVISMYMIMRHTLVKGGGIDGITINYAKNRWQCYSIKIHNQKQRRPNQIFPPILCILGDANMKASYKILKEWNVDSTFKYQQGIISALNSLR